MFKVILWDIDGTLLDFTAAERAAIRSCFAQFGMGECTDAMLADYGAINQTYWRALERGEVTKRRVLEGRFEDFFAKYGLPSEHVAAFNEEYQIRLGDTICFTPGALETVRLCRDAGILQYAVTNGTKLAQDRKLRRSGLVDIFDGVFISDVIGFEKPTAGFFAPVLEAAMSAVPGLLKSEILIVGDSPTSDMRGGIDAGIATCWYRRAGEELPEGMKVDFAVEEVGAVREILWEAAVRPGI